MGEFLYRHGNDTDRLNRLPCTVTPSSAERPWLERPTPVFLLRVPPNHDGVLLCSNALECEIGVKSLPKRIRGPIHQVAGTEYVGDQHTPWFEGLDKTSEVRAGQPTWRGRGGVPAHQWSSNVYDNAIILSVR